MCYIKLNATPLCAPRSVALAGERILIVDDSAEARDFLAEYVLRPNGYEPLTARDGREGLLMAREASPDLIILDMQMPGLSGVEVLEALRKEGLDIPVILSTFHGSEELAVQAFRLGARDYVIKPFEVKEILAAVERALQEARLRRERDDLTRELQELNARLQQQLQELNAIYTIGKSVTSVLDLELVLNRVTEAATYMARAEQGSLMLLDEQTGELYLRAAKNIEEKTARRMRVRVDDSLAGRVIQTGRPVLLAGEQTKKIATAYLVKALLSVPLRSPGRGPIGVLTVANVTTDRSFTEHDIFILSALADYAAIAIENANLFSRLQKEKGTLEAILQGMAEGVLVTDLEGRIILCNDTAAQALNIDPRRSLGQPVSITVTNPDLLDLFLRPPLEGDPAQTEVSLPDGRTFNAHISTVPHVGKVVVMQDVTHLKELDRIRAEFVSTVSHDLRTPLTTIQGYVELLPRVGPLNERQMEFISHVRRSMKAITELISDLLDLGRIEAGYDLEMHPLRVDPIIEDAAAELRPEAEAKKQSLTVQIAPNIPLVLGNARRIRQVLTNLISNAVKYTPEGGHIWVTAQEKDRHLLIRVQDDGLGIPYADQPYIFNKFFRVATEETADIPGTGLGLSIVKSVVDRHRGRVWVESTPGEGSTFYVLLPAYEESGESAG